MRKLLILSLYCIGCTDIKSSALNTNGIHAEISAIAVDGKTLIDVTLKAGDANSITYVELDAGDELQATDGSQTYTLDHSYFASLHSYDTEFNQTEPGTEFTVSLLRELEDNAPSSLAKMTEDVTLIVENDVHDRQNPLTISWEAVEPDDETLYLDVSGPCIFSIEREVPLLDSSYTIDGSDFETSNSESDEQSCEIDIIIERRKSGTLDPAYGSGTIYGGVRKQTSIRLNL